MSKLTDDMEKWFNPPDKEGIWKDHTCWRCNDGKGYCQFAGIERNCDCLRARND